MLSDTLFAMAPKDQPPKGAKGRRRAGAIAWLAAGLMVPGLAAGCGTDEAAAPSGDTAELSARTARQVADRAVEALAAHDFEALAELAHPERGVRFSPYATVDPERDVVLSASELRNAAQDGTPKLWGRYDGTGEPIRSSIGEYFQRFVYDVDFAAADEVARDRRLGRGNSLHNVDEVYPEATFVEYHVEGIDPDLGGMDWRSLRLVLERYEGAWKLVGVVHDEWTV